MFRGNVIRVDATVHAHFSSERNFKKLRASVEFLEHPLVIRRGEVRHGDLKCRSFTLFDTHAFAFDFAADPINSPGTLLNRRRVPTQVVMENMPTLTVQVDSFLSNGSGHEDFRAVRGIETEKIAVAVL